MQLFSFRHVVRPYLTLGLMISEISVKKHPIRRKVKGVEYYQMNPVKKIFVEGF